MISCTVPTDLFTQPQASFYVYYHITNVELLVVNTTMLEAGGRVHMTQTPIEFSD